MRALALIALTFALFGCEHRDPYTALADRFMFARAGGTVFGNPGSLTMKEIHLDAASLRGKEVVIEGKVTDVSEHFTYMVVADDQARMLVVLTGIASAGPALKRDQPKSVRVLGTIESGQKGLPYVMARAVNVVQDPGA